MNTPLRAILRSMYCVGVTGVVIGGGMAIGSVLQQRHVREFQAGEGSPFAERLLAITMRTAIETVGFLALGLLAGCVAAGLTGLLHRAGPTTYARRFTAWTLSSLAAFVVMATFGAWLGNEALPFLDPIPLLIHDVLGFLGILLVLGILAGLVRSLPFAPREDPVACALGTILAAPLGGLAGFELLQLLEGSSLDPVNLALAAIPGLLSIPLGALFARLLASPIQRLASRLERGPLIPRPVGAILLGLGLVAAAVAAPQLQLSALPGDVQYRNLKTRGTPRGKNVVLVTIDTLRADHLGCYGYERDTSPFIDALAAQGVVCEDASSPASWTKPATGTILTGLYPSRHGALYHGSLLRLPEGHKTLAETFRDEGYVTAGFVTNPNVKTIFDFDRGFEEFFDSPVEDTVTLAAIRGSIFGGFLMQLMRHQFNWKYENDVLRMNEHILAWLRENKEERFFLYLHYIDPHIPYSPPARYRDEFRRDHGLALFNERKEGVGIDLYDGEIRYTDDGMRELVEELQRLGIWDDTLFVLTSDHGEEFFEHGVLGHGFSLYQGVVHVPLIFHGPGITKGGRVSDPVQIVDMPATVLDLAGLGQDVLGDGRSFASSVRVQGPGEERLLFLENEFGTSHDDNRSFVLNGVRKGPYKFVLTERNMFFPPEEYGGVALYDLENDPAETENLIESEEHRELVELLLERLRAHTEFLVTTGFRDAGTVELSDELQENLRALGYF